MRRLSAVLLSGVLLFGLLFCGKSLFANEALTGKEIPGKDASETAAVLMQKALTAYQEQRPLEVVRLLGEARTLARQQNDKPGEALTAFLYAGLYERMGLLEKAQESEAQARAFLKEINDPATTATVLSCMGVGYKIIARPQRAAEFLKEAIAVSRAAGNKAVEGFALVNLGWIEKDAGQLQDAWLHLPQGAALLREAGDAPGEAWALQGVGWLHADIAQGDKARELMQQSLQIIRAPRPASTDTSMLGLAKASVFDARLVEGKALASLGTFGGSLDQQISYFEEALPLIQATRSRFYHAQILSELGARYRTAKQPEKARQTLEQALRISRELGIKSSEAGVLGKLGEIEGDGRNWERATALTREAAAIFEALGNSGGQAYELSNIARFEEQAGHFDEAKKARLAALEIWESWRQSLGGLTDAKTGFLSTRLGSYQEYIGFLLRRGEVEEALTWVEKTKARALVDLMESGKVDIQAGASAAEKARENELRAATMTLNNQLVAESAQPQPDAAKIATLKTQLAQAERDWQTFTQALYAAHPELAGKRAARTKTASEIAASLPPDTALLNYTFANSSKNSLNLICVTTRQGKPQIQSYPLEKSTDELTELLDDFREACASPNGKYKGKARELYKILLAPAAAQIAGKSRLVVCPEGPLWGTPFSALMDGDRFIVEQYEVNYAYSATALQSAMTSGVRAARPQPAHNLLVFANPDFGGAERFQTTTSAQTSASAQTSISGDIRPLTADSRPLTADARAMVADSRALTADARSLFTRSGGILPLPGTRREADALKTDFPDARLQTEDKAQEAIAKSEAGNYRYLHFATHGLFNDAVPMLSSVVLAQPPKDSAEDGFLTAREIFNLDLKADLVVLSACDTARGEKKSGEGVVGLTWALFVAGAPSQVVSQWAVNDAGTAKLMQAFYANLKAKQPKGAALRAAELSLLKDGEHGHPYYWAPFILFGEWN